VIRSFGCTEKASAAVSSASGTNEIMKEIIGRGFGT
jgi:hypothetical protein